MTLLQRAAKSIRTLYATPKNEVTQSGFIAEGAIVARALISKLGAVVLAADAGGITLLKGGLGYATGAGGAVTQITDATTGVTLSKACGQVTTVALTTAAGAEEVFTVTNTKVAATDVVVVSTTYAGAGTILVSTKKTVTGAFDIVITNLHASAALNALAVINFAVVKAVAA